MDTEPTAEQDLIDRMIDEAEARAGDDDAAFVHILRESYFAATAGRARSTQGGRTRSAPGAPYSAPADRSTRIFEDPRYQRNARQLARKTRGRFRVIGGTDVPPGEFMDCVAVGGDTRWGCTGTLIAPNVVLTAGHCAGVATRVYFGSDVTRQGRIVRVERGIRHPDYNRGGQRNDLLVLLLEEEVTDVEPRRIAPAGLIDGATDGRVVGFGNVDFNGSFGYGVKRQVDVPIASPSCSGSVDGEEDSVAYGCDVGLELIAGKPLLARDSCTGDSGGPYLVADGDQWLLAGATSRATDSAVSTCGDGGVYVRVDRYVDWIESVAGIQI